MASTVRTPESGRTAGRGGGGGPDGGTKVRGTEAGQIYVTPHRKGFSLWFLQAINIQIEPQRRQGEFERRLMERSSDSSKVCRKNCCPRQFLYCCLSFSPVLSASWLCKRLCFISFDGFVVVRQTVFFVHHRLTTITSTHFLRLRRFVAIVIQSTWRRRTETAEFKGSGVPCWSVREPNSITA